MIPTFFTTPLDFRSWLEKKHDQEKEIWVGLYKKNSDKKGITYLEAVEQGLCFGWIDSLTKRIDEESYMIRFTPRRPDGNWTETNVSKVLDLKKRGLLHPAGLRTFEERKK